MKIKIQPDLNQPLYLQISEQIQGEIALGRLAAGQRLPPVRALADQMGVNFNTVARAYRHLDRLGWIRVRQGRGAQVQPSLEPGGHSKLRQASLEKLADNYVSSARRLGFEDAEIMNAVQAKCFT